MPTIWRGRNLSKTTNLCSEVAIKLIDWAIVAAFVVSSVALSLWRGRRAGKNVEEFFIAGRSLGWFMAGTSMVATTFSSDTPLFVAGAVRSEGIYANWIWWAGALGTLASIFFFANLWRRSEVSTEIELIELRYPPSRQARALRVFKALLDGVFNNCLIMASVTYAAMVVSQAIMGLSPTPLLVLPMVGPITPVALVVLVLGATAVAYSTRTGFNGVVYSDALQFGLAMAGAVALAVVTMMDVGERGSFADVVRSAVPHQPHLLDFFPEPGLNLPFFTFVILITVAWLPAAPGSGFFLQRVLASKTERDAVLGFSWFAFCHYVLRSWPWIVVGAASVVYLPDLANAESSYPKMINLLLPVGLKGLMIASLLAAFMSCITSQLNWGSSYVVNDVYKPYMARGRSATHYVKAARISMLLLALTTGAVIPQLTSILGVYKFLGVVATGSTVALIGRWYWWRINVWSEITGVVGGIVVGTLLIYLCPDQPGKDLFAVRLLLNLLICGVLTIVVTFATSPQQADEQTLAFYRKVRPPGAGWVYARALTGLQSQDVGLKKSGQAWLGAAALLYGALLAPGYALFGNWTSSLLWVLVGIVGGVVLSLSRVRLGEQKKQPAQVSEVI